MTGGIKNDASLRGKVRAVAKECGLRSQEVLNMYLFEHLLLRLSQSGYADKFILKGGLLIAAITGMARRTTMDMDTTVSGMDMDEGSVCRAVRDICAVRIEDGMEYELERVEPIRDGDEYANWRAHIRVHYGRIDAPIKLDITTGDAITPRQVRFDYPLMFDEGAVGVLSYPLVTILAEKFETVVRRGAGNTRGRDYYDIFVFVRTRRDSIDAELLGRALIATAAKRGSSALMADYAARLEEVRASDAMMKVWERYAADAPYASDVKFDEVIDAALELGCIAIGQSRETSCFGSDMPYS